MKTYIIFAAIAAFSTIAIMSIPQLTGKVFVNNRKEQKPVDWLSAQVLKFQKKHGTVTYDIPAHIHTIKIIGGAEHPYGQISVQKDKRHVIYSTHDGYFDALLTIVQDTLIIAGAENNKPLPSLTLYIDSNIHKLILNNQKTKDLHINHKLPFEILVENQSDVFLRGNENTKLTKMSVSDRSTFSISQCFTPTIDMQIDNSMVYVDLSNNIDSLKANLIGKSNIKLTYTMETKYSARTSIEESHITKSNVNIYPAGNLEYYHLSEKKKKH
ncbi:MAG TPA: hypothetical protein PKA53_05520 [Sphingobacterium sp.]|nr:hypothetical protein [Sphingobacterium sp.]